MCTNYTVDYVLVVISYAIMGIVTTHLQAQKARKADSRTKDDLKIRLAIVANRISRATIPGLIRVSPALVQRAIPREACLTETLLRPLPIRNRIRANTNIAITTLHNRKVVSGPILTSILTISKLEKRLRLPLARSSPFGVAREAHTEVFEGRGDSEHFLGCDVGGFGAFKHLEAAGDLVEGYLFGEGAVVPDVDVERV